MPNGNRSSPKYDLETIATVFSSIQVGRSSSPSLLCHEIELRVAHFIQKPPEIGNGFMATSGNE